MAVEDMADAAKVASEEATRHSHWSGCFVTTAKLVRRGGVAVRTRSCAETLRRSDATQRFEENLGRAGFEPAKA